MRRQRQMLDSQIKIAGGPVDDTEIVDRMLGRGNEIVDKQKVADRIELG